MQKLDLAVIKMDPLTKFKKIKIAKDPRKSSDLINIAVIGCGYWGPNLVRNFAQLNNVNVYALCDLDVSRAQELALDFAPNAHVSADYRDIFNDPKIHGVAIASPAASHFSIAQEALSARKDVLVEKPLAMSVKECQKLISLAEKLGSVLMVGHTFIFNVAVRKIKEYIDDGLLGNIIYIHSRRLNLGRVQTDINAMWSLSPHDISMLLYWLGEDPVRATSSGFSYLNHGVEDIVFMTLEFPNGIKTYSHSSWLDPKKVREITIVGTKKMLVYDDVATEGKIQIYDKSVNLPSASSHERENLYPEFQMKNLYGDVMVPYLPFQEPLQMQCQHFIDCIRSGTSPLTNGQEGLRIVRVLEAAQYSLKKGGLPVEIIPSEKEAILSK